MTIVTKTGDKGETGLFGGQRVSKSDIRMHATGTVDELNAVIGLCLAEMGTNAQLTRIQNVLFRLGADLATPRMGNANPPRIEPMHIQELEDWIDAFESSIQIPNYFILPGGSKAASFLHLARTVCRRAERFVVELRQKEDLGTNMVIYLNRLSDYLFLAAMQANKDANITDIRVEY